MSDGPFIPMYGLMVGILRFAGGGVTSMLDRIGDEVPERCSVRAISPASTAKKRQEQVD